MIIVIYTRVTGGYTGKAKSCVEAWVPTRETERGGPCRPIETEVNRDSGSTYGRVSFLGYVPQIEGVIAYSYGKIVL